MKEKEERLKLGERESMKEPDAKGNLGTRPPGGRGGGRQRPEATGGSTDRDSQSPAAQSREKIKSTEESGKGLLTPAAAGN